MFSLSNLAAALQGNPVEDGSEEEEDQEQESVEASDSGKQGAIPSINLWHVASSIRNTVKQRTAEFAASIQETDWSSELNALQQGLKEDTGEIKELAKVATEELSHKAKTAAQNLPGMIENLPEHAKQASTLLNTGAKGAQHQIQQATRSISTLGHKVVHGASDLFDQVSHAIQNEMALQDPAHFSGRGPGASSSAGAHNTAAGVKYSRFEADVAAMQRDSSTYCDEPDDEENYEGFLKTFDLAQKKPDIDKLIAENTFMSELQSRIVPLIVEYDVFWTRYFYRLHKLEQKHEQFVQLTQRAEQTGSEEVGWGSDDDDDHDTAVEVPPSDTITTTIAVAAGVVETEEPEEEEAQPSPSRERQSISQEGISSTPLPAQNKPQEAAVERGEDVENEEIKEVSPSLASDSGAALASAAASDDDKTFVATTASEGSENSGKDAWCEVKPKPSGSNEDDSEPAATTSNVAAAGVVVVNNEKEGVAVVEEDTLVEADKEDSDDFGADIEGDAAAAAAAAGDDDDDDDEDWGDDVADWE